MRRTRRCLPQQLGQRGKCNQAYRRLGSQSGLIGAGRSIKHPGRNLQPTIPARAGQRAAECNAIRPRDRLMDGDLKSTPGMPRIQQLTKDGPVGVLKLCSTTRSARAGPSAIRCRSRCTIPMAHPARHRDTGRKLHPPAVQRSGAEQTHTGLWSPLDERWG